MGVVINHNKIINQAAREILKPNGLFQKGQSRLWVDDNGWFLILVEFQPSAWDKGTYLNVAIHYLWKKQDYLSFDYGHRVNEFIAFGGDETKFYSDMLALSEKALETVKKYREFNDKLYAMEQIVKRNGNASLSKELYDKMMICGLTGDTRATIFCKRLKESVQHSEVGWEKEYYTELVENILPIITDAEIFQKYIVDKIKSQRDFWHNKSSMKKLKSYLEWNII